MAQPFAITPRNLLRSPTPHNVLILECSGGSGHKRAAAIVAEELDRKHVYNTRIDVLNSAFTIRPAVGRWCSGLWDRAQSRGAVGTLDKLVTRWQSPMLRLCYYPAYSTMTKLLNTANTEGELPDRVMATSAMFLPSIAAAVERVNKKTPARHVEIDLYMTELPTDQTHHFYRPLKYLSAKQAALLTLHTAPPRHQDVLTRFDGNEAAYWRAKTGHLLRVRHTWIVGRTFTHLVPTRRDTAIELKAQSAEELAFARQHFSCVSQADTPTYAVHIGELDRVTLLMLGGIPTVPSILNYVRQAVAHAPRLNTRCVVFIACGPPHNSLYKSVVRLLENQAVDRHLLIVPFTAQDLAPLFARADSTITRSGGMTSIEILRMKAAGSAAQIYIHSEKATRFTRGVPAWEAGNADYLHQAYRARPMTPSTLELALGLAPLDGARLGSVGEVLAKQQERRRPRVDATFHRIGEVLAEKLR